jgi:hypothetical protein
MFEVGQFNFNYEAIVVLVNAENKIGFSSIGKLRQHFPIAIQEYLASKIEIGNIKIIEEKNHKIILLPYKQKYVNKLDIDFYVNIVKGFKQIEQYVKQNNIKSLFLYDFNIENMDWNYLSSMITWYFLLLLNTTIYTEKPIERLDRDNEAQLLNCLETCIS